MRIHRLIAIVVAVLFAAPALAQGPSPNNAVWGVSDQNEVFRWKPVPSWAGSLERMPGRLKQVSVGTDGAVWGVDPDDNLLRWTGSEWQQVQGRLRQLSVRNAQEVWGVNAANDLFRWNGAEWQQIPIPGKFKHVSVGVDGAVWAVDTLGRPVRRDGSTWTVVSNQHAPLTVGSSSIPAGNITLERISVADAQRVLGIGTITGDPARRPAARWTGTGWDIISYRTLDVVEAANGDRWEIDYRDYVQRDGESVPFDRRLRIYNSKDPSWQAVSNLDVVNPGVPVIALRQIAVGSAGSPTPPTPPPTGPSLTAEQQQMLEAHNGERRNNYPGVGALQWSPELAQYAQEWAQRLANTGRFEHRQGYSDNPFRPGEHLGENINRSWTSGPATGREAGDAVRSWISEKQWYHYDQDDGLAGYANQPPGCTPPPDNPYCGHFTQVVWKATQFVGCGKATAARDGRNYTYVVCNYYPGGNTRGQKPY